MHIAQNRIVKPKILQLIVINMVIIFHMSFYMDIVLRR